MSKTKYIKDKSGKFAGSIGEGKDNIPISYTIPQDSVARNNTAAQTGVFEQLGSWAEQFDHLAVKQRQGRHSPYVPLDFGKYSEPGSAEGNPLTELHARATYNKPCPGCGETNPNLRYRAGTSTYCYDCASYKALAKRSEANGWTEVATQEEFLEWRKNQKRVCYYCGIDEKNVFKQGVRNTRAGGNLPESLGNDRWDSSKPYVISNLVLSCFACNQLKSNTMTGDEFIKYFADACTRRSRDMVEAYDTAHKYCCPQG